MGTMRDIFYPPENGTGGGYPDPRRVTECRFCRLVIIQPNMPASDEWVHKVNGQELCSPFHGFVAEPS